MLYVVIVDCTMTGRREMSGFGGLTN
ncbi:hypothetical protein TMatcc_008399 [Talaromyces marneffei ATCC 18224]